MSQHNAVVAWSDIADYWDQKQADTGDLWHRALIDPTVLRLIGTVAGLRVLDLGCGNGYLARKLARAGAKVFGVDSSVPVIAMATARETAAPLGVTFAVADAAAIGLSSGPAFDLIVCNMVLMDLPHADEVLREAARVLVPGGRMVASIEHPCFQTGSGSAWLIEHGNGGPPFSPTVARKISRYRDLYAEDNVPWRIGPDLVVYTRRYHRPLSWYVRAFDTAGLAIATMEEPEPAPEFMQADDQAPYIRNIPLHLVIEAFRR